MTWEDLLADLELRFAADRAAALTGEVEERRQAELRALGLTDRLRPLLGASTTVTVALDGHDPVRGTVAACGPDWLLLAGLDEVLIRLDHVTWIDGISARAELPKTSRAAQALDLRHALTGLARDRSAVRIQLRGGATVHGTLDAVGRDHVLLAVHAADEPRRSSAVSGIRAIPLRAIAAVRRGA